MSDVGNSGSFGVTSWAVSGGGGRLLRDLKLAPLTPKY